MGKKVGRQRKEEQETQRGKKKIIIMVVKNSSYEGPSPSFLLLYLTILCQLRR
jgi:hypothetical protein